MKYTGQKTIPTDFCELAEAVVGAVEWESEHAGFCKCPGEHLHTRPTQPRDCRVYLDADNGYAPTIHCFHDSCRELTAQANFSLRSSIGKAAYRQGGGCQRIALSKVIADPFEAFLTACFEPGDILSIAPGFVPDDAGRAVPEHGGVNVFSRDHWLSKVKNKGGIEKLFSSRNGLYIRINPVTAKSRGGDKDVTAYRHTLIESDKIPKGDQERILRDSGLPIAALIDSGGESIHAWVRVDAPDKEEYHERRERLWASLPEGFVIDGQNKNPSRFSRCPGGLRGDAVQRLLDVNLGPASFEQWEQECDGLGLAPPMRVSQLSGYDTENDPNNVLGNRWLCRGGSLIIVGQSGIGKSSYSMQLAVMWALGKAVFNIKPVRPLKSLIIQAENDIGDLAEMFQGVRAGMGLTAEDDALLEENLIFYRDTIHSGADFAKTAETLINRHQPDLVWGDPLLNYIGDDASQQKVVSEFCGRQHWTGSDFAYSGLGSSALTNWAREVAVLMRVKTPEGMPPTFRFELCKRRRRAGMTDTLGNPTESIYLCHGQSGICWQQCAPPPEPEKSSGTTYTIGKRKGRGRPKAEVAAIDEFEGLRQLTNDMASELSAKYGVSTATIKRRWKAFKTEKINQEKHTHEDEKKLP